jgi:hypothetical protein
MSKYHVGLYQEAVTFIGEHPGSTFADVAAAFGLTKGHASTMLSVLHARGELVRGDNGRPCKYSLPGAEDRAEQVVATVPEQVVTTVPEEATKLLMHFDSPSFHVLADMAAELAAQIHSIEQRLPGKGVVILQMACEMAYEGDVWLMVGQRKS